MSLLRDSWARGWEVADQPVDLVGWDEGLGDGVGVIGLFGMRTWGDGRRVGWAGWDEGLGDGRSKGLD